MARAIFSEIVPLELKKTSENLLLAVLCIGEIDGQEVQVPVK